MSENLEQFITSENAQQTATVILSDKLRLSSGLKITMDPRKVQNCVGFNLEFADLRLDWSLQFVGNLRRPPDGPEGELAVGSSDASQPYNLYKGYGLFQVPEPVRMIRRIEKSDPGGFLTERNH